jgi:ABC-2 type transport system ATP-binding protein
MRQRLAIANALLSSPDLLILDEPTNGMDPQGTREIRHLVRQLAADGTTIFVSSHLLAEIEQVCTHVAVMNLGRLVTQGSLQELTSTTTAQLRVRTRDTQLACRVLASRALDARTVDDHTVIATVDGQQPEELCRVLVEAGVGVAEFLIRRPSLEDTFVALTGEGFDVVR